MNRRLLLAAAVALTLVAGARPARANFDDVVRALETRHGIHPTSIPFLGLARFAVWMIHPKGVHDFRLATFENVHLEDPGAAVALVRANAGPGFRPLVEARSARSGDWTVILAQPLASGVIRLLVFAHDHHDTTLVQTDVDPKSLASQLDHPIRLGRN